MIKEFCDICGKEIKSNENCKISLRIDIGNCNDSKKCFSTLHSDPIALCESCMNKIPQNTGGLDDDLMFLLKEKLSEKIDKEIII